MILEPFCSSVEQDDVPPPSPIHADLSVSGASKDVPDHAWGTPDRRCAAWPSCFHLQRKEQVAWTKVWVFHQLNWRSVKPVCLQGGGAVRTGELLL